MTLIQFKMLSIIYCRFIINKFMNTNLFGKNDFESSLKLKKIYCIIHTLIYCLINVMMLY